MSRNFRIRRRVGLSVQEALGNVRGWLTVATLIAILAAAVGAAITSHTVHSAEADVTQIETLQLEGRHVLRVVPQAGRIDSAFCDGLQANSAVLSSYAVLEVRQVGLTIGQAVTTQLVTAGFLRYFDVASHAVPGSMPRAIVGSTLAGRLGIVDGGWIAFNTDAPLGLAGQVVTTQVLPQTLRSTSVDDSVVIVHAPTMGATECIVEPQPAARTDLAASIDALASVAVDVLPLDPDIAAQTEPDRRLAALPADIVTLGGSGVAILALLAWWFLRRAEWALYRAFGMRSGALVGIAVAEWTGVIAIPMLIGGAWGIAFTRTGTAELAYHLGIDNLAVALVISSAAVGVWSAYSVSSSVNLALRGM